MKEQVKCTSIFGHSYEPRYDLGESKWPTGFRAEYVNVEAILNKFRTKTYVCDICVKCGHVIKK